MVLSADSSVVLCLSWQQCAQVTPQLNGVNLAAFCSQVWVAHMADWSRKALGCFKGSVKMDTSAVAREQHEENSMCLWSGWIFFSLYWLQTSQCEFCTIDCNYGAVLKYILKYLIWAKTTDSAMSDSSWYARLVWNIMRTAHLHTEYIYCVLKLEY